MRLACHKDEDECYKIDALCHRNEFSLQKYCFFLIYASNQHIFLCDYILGFNLYKASFAELGEVDLTALKALSEASATIYAEILAADTAEKLEAAIIALEELVAGENVVAVLGNSVKSEEEATDPDKSVAAYYNEWLAELIDNDTE